MRKIRFLLFFVLVVALVLTGCSRSKPCETTFLVGSQPDPTAAALKSAYEASGGLTGFVQRGLTPQVASLPSPGALPVSGGAAEVATAQKAVEERRPATPEDLAAQGFTDPNAYNALLTPRPRWMVTATAEAVVVVDPYLEQWYTNKETRFRAEWNGLTLGEADVMRDPAGVCFLRLSGVSNPNGTLVLIPKYRTDGSYIYNQ